MQTATVRVSTSEHNEVIKRWVTPAEAVILARLHEGNTKGAPIGVIIVTDEEAGTPDGLDKEGKPKFRARTSKEERERLGLTYTGTIGHGKDVKPALTAVFPNAMEPLPETFEDILEFLGPKAEVTTPEELKAVEEATAEAKAKVADAKAKAKEKTAKGKKGKEEAAE